jgi:hypothetical protein
VGRVSRIARAAAVGGAVAALALIAIPAAFAAFAAQAQNEGDVVTAAPDFTPPAISATVVAKTLGGATGFVRKGGAYYAYANVATDTGNPASGIATVKANLAELTAGQGEAALTAGTYSAGGVSYNYRSAELTSSANEGVKTYSVTATDNAGNARMVEGSATVDNTVPAATDVQTANAGTNGLAEQGDSISFTFSEPIEPASILSGWNGSATNVVVRMVDNGLLGLATGNDALQVYNAANSALLPLGVVDMGRGDYVAGLLGGTITFGASGTASTMTMSANTVTVTFGTYAAVGLLVGRTTAGGAGTMTWTPVATPYDRAGNVMSTTAAAESGTGDRDF